MEKNNELQKVDIKYHTCYYFDYIIKIEDLFFNIGWKINWKWRLYKTLSGEKSLRIIYNKVDGFIWGYWGTKYLELFGFEKYLIGLETSVTSCFFS